MKIEHKPVGPGDTCARCGALKAKHRAPRARAYHVTNGDPCTKCGRAASIHVSRVVIEGRAARDTKRKGREAKRTIIGVDGEGHDTPDGGHVYTYLCAVNEDGRVVSDAYNPDGLSTLECVRMLLEIPENSLRFVFMGSYDWTKIIEDLSPVDRFYIMHPDARRRRVCKQCKKTWSTVARVCPRCSNAKENRSILVRRVVRTDKHGRACRFAFDWMNGSFSVAEPVDDTFRKYRRDVKIWDCFKFFQSSFVSALKAWRIGTPEQIERIDAMKKKRGTFANEDPEEIRRYCQEECHLLAVMMRTLIEACKVAGIDLRRYDGAGAIANALLKKYGVKAFLGPPLESLSEGLEKAVMSAYFGGRFENSVVGDVKKPVIARDIHSAYPYALSQLPCLACGKWMHLDPTGLAKPWEHDAGGGITKKRGPRGGNTSDKAPGRVLPSGRVTAKKRARLLATCRSATLAVVRFRVAPRSVHERAKMAWCPLPFRDKKGSICFPTGCEGWAWFPEFEAALKGWPELVTPLEAYVYRTECEHSPFGWMPDAYRKRCEWGKDGPGIVMKLGTNACAGKTMQSIGDAPPFKSWIWGGMTTATTRAQSLEAIRVAKDPWNVLAIATDGVFSTEDLRLPHAQNIGTHDLPKPLGEWGRDCEHGKGWKDACPECLRDSRGMFLVKPGMYFDGKSLMRARGIGRKELADYRDKVVSTFARWDRKRHVSVRVQSRRFYGARSSVYGLSTCMRCNVRWPGAPELGCPTCREIATHFEVGEQTLPEDVCSGCGFKLPRGRATPEACRKCKRPWHPLQTSVYGRWAARPIEIDFACYPKREHVSARPGSFARMRLRDMGGATSAPYAPGETTPEGIEARAATEAGLEQPDWDDDD